MCPAPAGSVEIGLGVDVAQRASVWVDGPPGDLGQDDRRQRLGQRPETPLAGCRHAAALASPGSRRSTIGNGRPRPSCSSTTAPASDVTSTATIDARTAGESVGMSPPTTTTIGAPAAASPREQPGQRPLERDRVVDEDDVVRGSAGISPGAAATTISDVIGRTRVDRVVQQGLAVDRLG